MNTFTRKDYVPGRNRANEPGEDAVPTRPTPAKPGSAEKLAILAERFERREPLWHPEDAKLPVSGGLIDKFLRDVCDTPKA